MVHVVNSSTNYGYGCGYREINQQLAKENGDLKQQLGMAVSEINHHRSEIHRRDVEILDLNRQIRELKAVKAKYFAIREIILEKGPVESIHHLEASIRAIEQAHDTMDEAQDESQPSSLSNLENIPKSLRRSSPSTSNSSSPSTVTANETGNSTFDANNSENIEANGLDRISERSELSTVSQSSATSSSTELSESINDTQQPVNDSLDPPDVTSVPPLQPERTMHTPSIWNCLDPLDDPNEQSQTTQQNEEEKITQADGLGDVTQREEEKNDEHIDTQQEQHQEEDPQHSDIQGHTSPNANAGLKVSNNMNASSPIQPITRKGNHLLADCMFQSTPVQKQRDPSIALSPITIPHKDNQENVQALQPNDSQSAITKAPVANKGRGKRQKPVNREVTFEGEPTQPTRLTMKVTVGSSHYHHEETQKFPSIKRRSEKNDLDDI